MQLRLCVPPSLQIFVIGLKREIFEGFSIIFVAKVKEIPHVFVRRVKGEMFARPLPHS